MDMAWIGFLVIGLATGWLARRMMNDRGYGRVWDIVAGVIGALLGGVFFSKASVLAGSSILGSFIVAALGAIALVFGVRMLKKV